MKSRGEKILKRKSKVGRLERNNKNSYLFVLPYGLVFGVFI